MFTPYTTTCNIRIVKVLYTAVCLDSIDHVLYNYRPIGPITYMGSIVAPNKEKIIMALYWSPRRRIPFQKKKLLLDFGIQEGQSEKDYLATLRQFHCPHCDTNLGHILVQSHPRDGYKGTDLLWRILRGTGHLDCPKCKRRLLQSPLKKRGNHCPRCHVVIPVADRRNTETFKCQICNTEIK